MLKNSLYTLLIFSFLAIFCACKSTTSVELFRVNDNGEIVNIGHGYDNGHTLYGHFRTPDRYDRAAATLISPAANSAVCHINVNDGTVNDGAGDGIRIEPCTRIELLSEGKITGELDNIAVFFHETEGPEGIYRLYQFAGGVYQTVISRPVSDELWNSGANILSRQDDGSIRLIFSRNGVTETQVLSAEEIRRGDALDMPPAAEMPANEESPDSQIESAE